MKKSALFLLLFLACPFYGFAQVIGPLNPYQKAIAQNSISNLAVFGDSVWIGPQLQYNIGNSNDWIFPEGLDSIQNGKARVYALTLAKDTIFAGLGDQKVVQGNNVDRAFGFYRSTDGGNTWDFIDFQTEIETDISYIYGSNSLTKLPVTVREQSPPYSVAIQGNTFFAAAWASGLIRSTDGGQTFERLLIPPTNLDSLDPSKTYNFEFNPRNDNNFLGFSVFIDDKNTVWFGSAGGLNWSDNALFANKNAVKWYHKAVNTAYKNPLPGNWIIFIKQQPGTNRIWMTNWPANNGEIYAISYTDDRGKSFHRFLEGEKIYSITFFDQKIVATGENGLFISEDDGLSWNQQRHIRSANSLISSNTSFYSVDSSPDRVWIGSSEGLITTTNFVDYDIIRVNFPLKGGNQSLPNPKAVQTYAYPNPFSISRHTYARIVFESNGTQSIKIGLYDFAMNKITELKGNANGNGQYEALWNGLDSRGRVVPNGLVFYIIETGGKKYNGKILVMD